MNSRFHSPRFAAASAICSVLLAPGSLAWQVELDETQRLDPTSPTVYQTMGTDVDIDGNTLIAGAPENINAGPGKAYIYTFDGTSWTLQQKLNHPTAVPGETFGRTVGIDGNTAVISAFRTAYVFVRSGSTWTLQDELTPSQGPTSDYYGSSISVEGDTAIIGGYGMTDARVWVWTRTGTNWTIQQTLGGGGGSGFGISVSLLGNTLAIGANTDGQIVEGAGAVHVFTRNGTSWSQQAKIIGPQPFANRRIGTSVDLQSHAGTLEIAAGGAGNTSSRVLIFRGSGATWTQTAQLLPSTGGPTPWYGAAVAVDGDRLVVGAWRGDGNATTSGLATYYQRCGED